MTDQLDRLKIALSDRYTVERELGHGGMATVYLARDLKHDRMVALKVLTPELAAALGADRFLREIQIAARLAHPHILPLYDSGEVDGFLYYVMPYVEGESLRDRLDRERQLPVSEAIRIAREVADALDSAHRHEVIHRDIKPENILLEEGHAVVADFGIARAVSAAGGDQLTETGLTVGTPTYMSPEQAAGDTQVEGRSDIYSLGCVLYEMLAGQPPFTGPTAQEVIAKRFTDPIPPLGSARDTVPSALEEVVTKSLARLPADRFSTGADFAQGLAAVETAVPSGAVTPIGTTPTSQPRRSLQVAVGATALVAVAAGVWFLRGTPSASPGVGDGRPMLVVLPFENLGSPDDEYFADGITEEMTSRLAEISGLGVVSRTSALQFKGAGKTAGEIGDQLGVHYILEGTIRTDRLPDGTGQVRVTPQLIRVSDDTHLWTDRYTSALRPGEIFQVQANIAEQVATALDVTLLATEQRAIRLAPTENSQAHNDYLLGRFHWKKRSPEDLVRAAEYFSNAIGADSSYVRAWVGLADAYAVLPYYDVSRISRAEAYTRAKEAARHAVALDSTFAEAQASLAYAIMYGDWDWEESERLFRLALQLDPEYAVTRYWYAELLWITRRREEALTQSRRAAELDPLSVVAQNSVGLSLLFLERYREAEAAFRKALELVPSYGSARGNLAWALMFLGELDSAEAEWLQVGVPPTIVRAVIGAHADPSTRETARRIIADIERDDPSVRPWATAAFYALVGDADAAIERLDMSFRERSETALLMNSNPIYDDLRDDPRFHELLRRAGLAR